MMEGVTYESLRADLLALGTPEIQGERNTRWILSRKLGVARTSEGNYEIFIVGGRVYPRTGIVQRHLEYGKWEVRGTADRFEASRLVLPPDPHFIAVASLIVVELFRAGLGTERPLQDVFDDVEPLIEMALRRGALDEEHQVGLIGELLCLELMLDVVSARPELRMDVLDMWQGHRVGQRDFRIGSVAIEVKTTQQDGSTHKISGLHQVEPVSSDGASESGLFLLSVGLTASEHEGQSVPEVVQRVAYRLADQGGRCDGSSPLQRRFLEDVARYGANQARGYDHRTMAGWQVYRTRFRSTFTPRLYDLLDPELRIIRRRDLVGTFVSPDDIQYRMDLIPVLNGRNPSGSWQHSLVQLVGDALNLS